MYTQLYISQWLTSPAPRQRKISGSIAVRNWETFSEDLILDMYIPLCLLLQIGKFVTMH